MSVMQFILKGMLIVLLGLQAVMSAVSVSQDQTGQAIVVPYFTVANGLNTLVSINNTKNTAKAIKINIRDGRLGAAMYTFNLYLDANDIGTFALIAGLSYPQIITNDNSCALNFHSPPTGGAGGQSVTGWDEFTGLIEIIEMGNVLTASNDFFGEVTTTENCEKLNNAWHANGPNSFWQADPSAELSAVSGGLTADVSVIDVSNGFAFKVPILAFDNFFPDDTIYHREPASAMPDLDSGSHESLLLYQGAAIQTTWPTGYEAISALLMKTTIENEYDVTPELGANSEWVLSFPTAHFHQTHASSQSPFIFDDPQVPDDTDSFRFPADFSAAYTYYDREANTNSVGYACGLLPPGVPCPPESNLNHVVNTYLINPFLLEYTGSEISGPAGENIRVLNLAGSSDISNDFTAGKVKLNIITDFEDDGRDPIYAVVNDRGINTQTQARQFYYGLPVTGFALQMYRNNNAQPGLLATYASAKIHYGDRLITEEDD